MSQPSLSQQIQKLEEELGERLFDRMKREAKLTPHGEAFLPRAVKILEEVDVAKREASDARCLLRGRLIVGVLPTIAPYLLPEVLVTFAKNSPEWKSWCTKTRRRSYSSSRMCTKSILRWRVDRSRTQRMEVKDLFTEELRLALPPRHRLTRKRTVRLADLEKEPFIVMKEGHCLGDQVLNFCERRDLKPTINFRSAQLETIQALVRSGVGISLDSCDGSAQRSERLARVSFALRAKARTEDRGGLAEVCPLSRAANEFLKQISAMSKELKRQGIHRSLRRFLQHRGRAVLVERAGRPRCTKS